MPEGLKRERQLRNANYNANHKRDIEHDADISREDILSKE
jgi:hypothetical protein